MKMLKKLYAVHSPSGDEKRMRKLVARMCKGFRAETWTDSQGNLYVQKGSAETYPCVVAHLDQVQRYHSEDFVCVDNMGVLFGYSKSSHEQQGLGADDKNGIWVALKCLQEFDVMKCAFFVGEEIGCVGSSVADMSFFNDCRFVIQCDRKGNHDMIVNAAGVDLCSTDFILATNYKDYNYAPNYGSVTDVMMLKENGLKVSALNLSCGYFEPHTDHEFTEKEGLKNCLEFVKNIIRTCTDVYPHEYDKWNDWGNYTPTKRGRKSGGKTDGPVGTYSHDDFWGDDSWGGFSDVNDDENYMSKDNHYYYVANLYDEIYNYCLQNEELISYDDAYEYFIDEYPMLSDDDFDDIYTTAIEAAKADIA